MSRRRSRPLRPQRFDLVEVEWVDTEQDYEWTNYASFESKDPPTMRSVGFLYEDVRSRVSIFQTIDKSVFYSGNGLFDSILTIPKCSVQNITIIKRFNKNTHHGTPKS